jgi:hypothetical protein
MWSAGDSIRAIEIYTEEGCVDITDVYPHLLTSILSL